MNLESTTICFPLRLVFHCNSCPLMQFVSSTATCGFHCNLHFPLRLVSSTSTCVFHCNLCLPLCLVSSTATRIFHWNLHLPLQHVSSTATCVFHCNSCFPLLPVPDRHFWNLVVLGYKRLFNQTSLICKESEGCTICIKDIASSYPHSPAPGPPTWRPLTYNHYIEKRLC